jgi:myo-inositol 2-dehydrogenase / D-chiro-inositol 1-dehydrogenase
MTRFLLVGAGRIGKIHAENIVRSGRGSLAYVTDSNPAAAAQLAAAWNAGVAPLDSPPMDEVDAVLIASSTDTHADWIERSASAGKAVFCEKPLDLDIRRAESCLEHVRRLGTPLYMGFNRRYDPSFARLKRESHSGSIGKIETVHIISRDPSPPPVEYIARSGGLFRDMMIHDLDMGRWLLGEEPVEVFARGSALVSKEIGAAGDVDTAMVILRTASGTMCQISNSRRCAFGYDQRIEVFGSEGSASAGNHTSTSVTMAGKGGYSTEPALPFFLERYAAAYRLELEDFLNALQGKAVELATGEDGRRALKLADAAQASLTSGQAVKPAP